MKNNFEIKDFTLKDTKHIQMESIREFAIQLNYGLSDKCCFELLPWDKDFGKSDKDKISFKSMVMLHNQENYDNHGKEYERFGFDLHTWNKARAAKIVEHVNLTANKKKKSIHCHKHLVKFVKPYYEQMFLK